MDTSPKALKRILSDLGLTIRGEGGGRSIVDAKGNVVVPDAFRARNVWAYLRKEHPSLFEGVNDLVENYVTEAWGGSPRVIRVADVVVDDDDYGLISVDGTTVGHFRADKGFATVNVDGSEVDFRARTAKDVAKHIAKTYRLDKFLFQLV